MESRLARSPPHEPANLADILERVLDKGIVIAGDIQINLLDIELLTIKLRLLVASVDKAREMGIDWWASAPPPPKLAPSNVCAPLDRAAHILDTEHAEVLEQARVVPLRLCTIFDDAEGARQMLGREG